MSNRHIKRVAALFVAVALLTSGCAVEGNTTTQTTTQTTTVVTTTVPTTTTATTAMVTTTMVTTTKTTTKATTTAAPTTTVPTRPTYTLHPDHLSGWQVLVDGKQITASVIEDETEWHYVSLVPLLDSLEGVDRIMWEDDSHATIYRTPISDSPTAQGTIFSLDILTCALIQISPPTPTSLPAHTSDSNLLFMDLIGGGGTGAGYGVGPIRGCLVRDNEVFVDQYALMKVARHFDFEFDYLWEQKRMEITTPR